MSSNVNFRAILLVESKIILETELFLGRAATGSTGAFLGPTWCCIATVKIVNWTLSIGPELHHEAILTEGEKCKICQLKNKILPVFLRKW